MTPKIFDVVLNGEDRQVELYSFDIERGYEGTPHRGMEADWVLLGKDGDYEFIDGTDDWLKVNSQVIRQCVEEWEEKIERAMEVYYD